MTRVLLLTPPGTAAIAVIAVVGPQAWPTTRSLFRPAGKPLPLESSPGLHRFGRIGDGAGDEIMLFLPEADRVEIHCHGGRQIVRWLTATFVAAGAVEASSESEAERIEWLLSKAPTLRWASILLDQLHGAYRRKLDALRTEPNVADLNRLLAFAPITRHLDKPFIVALVGPPNVGKSSLMNALAGYTRSIVSPTAGTTRDLVTLDLAFDGVPIRLIDTAGIRSGADELETEGIARSLTMTAEADLVLQLQEAGSTTTEVLPNGMVVATKIDLSASTAYVGVSSVNGDGIAGLIAAVVRRLVPVFPLPGEAVATSVEELVELEAMLQAAS